MSLKVGLRENKFYLLIALIVLVVIVLAVFFSERDFTSAVVPSSYLDSGWYEDISEREMGSSFFGFEGWHSFTYCVNNDSYPAYLTVTTFKTLFMMSESDLRDTVLDTIVESSSEQDIFINMSSKITGERKLKNGHKTMYFVFQGNDSSGNVSEDVMFIGETWNCGNSGTSVICIGFAQISDNLENNSLYFEYWKKIVGDNKGTFGEEFKIGDGLIYNVRCHSDS